MPNSCPARFVLLSRALLYLASESFFELPICPSPAALFDVRKPRAPNAVVALFVVRGHLVAGRRRRRGSL